MTLVTLENTIEISVESASVTATDSANGPEKSGPSSLSGQRRSVGTRQRFEIFKRDYFTCLYCGRKPPEVVLHVDHIIAVANGGTNDDLNLVTSCKDCNLGKSDWPISQLPNAHQAHRPDLAERQEKLEQLKAMSEACVARKQQENDVFDIVLAHWMALDDLDPSCTSLRESVSDSIKTFLKRLPAAEIIDSINLAFNKTNYDSWSVWNARFRYFCAVCWMKIKNPDEAKRLSEKRLKKTTPKPHETTANTCVSSRNGEAGMDPIPLLSGNGTPCKILKGTNSLAGAIKSSSGEAMSKTGSVVASLSLQTGAQPTVAEEVIGLSSDLVVTAGG